VSGRPTTARGASGGDGALAAALAAFVRVALRTVDFLRDAAGRIPGAVTPVGWAVAASAAIFLVAGYLLGWVEAIVLGWAAVVLLLIAAAYLLGGLRHDIAVRLAAARVVAGDAAVGELVVRNPSRSRLGAIRLELAVGDGIVELVAPSLGRGEHFEDRFRVPAERRSVVTVGPVRAVRGDPLGLFRRESLTAGRRPLYVHPRTLAIPSLSIGLVRDLEGEPTRDLTADDVSFHALREYQPGDERRIIHWRSTAKTGTPMVRQFEETRRSTLMVLLSSASGDYRTGDEFELAVSAAGSLGVAAIREGREATVAVAVGGAGADGNAPRSAFARRLATATPDRLLDELSGLALSPSVPRIGSLAEAASDRASDTSVAFLVCGSAVTPSYLRRASSVLPLGVEAIAIVCDDGVAPHVAAVPGLTVVTIGMLGDLRAGLARSRAA
jgi:uncharacterized protein (DUF58 family)